MSVYLSKASPYYRFDFVDRGVRFHGSTKQKTKRKAEKVEKQERERVKYTPLLDRSGPVCLEIEAVAQDFAHAVSRHYADDSAAWRDLKRLVKYFGRETLLSHITDVWPAPGFEDTELGVFMEPEVDHGTTEVYARVQA